MTADSTPEPSPQAAPNTSAVVAPSPPADAPAGEIEDQYRLTPELVEEEAIRGDFMLRWAVILFALLLGWTVVSDTLTLVRIRSGQYMASHGILPPRTDVFSTGGEGRTWVNLGWLGDLLLAGVYQLGGDAALTILAALMAGVTFHFVVRTSITGVSTWWGSLIAMLAAVACFPHLTPNSIWTLLGVAVTCRILQRFDDADNHASLWPLVPCFWLWANLDRHMFVGLAVLLLWGIGRSATNLGLQPPKRVDLSRIWAPIGATCLAVMIHPWHYHVWTSPWLALGVEFPEVRLYASVTEEYIWQWHSIVSREFWRWRDIFVVFGLVTAGLALLSLLVNLKEVPFEHLLWFFGINGLAVAAGYLLPAATIVNVVIATLNAQAWYRRSFRQEYTVNAWALAYSRGGRALTVLAVFGLSYLAVTGWLMGAAGRRIGRGFEQQLSSSIASYEEIVPIGPDVDERRPFNFRPEEGDLLIWIGEKPFVDRRITLFATSGENLLEVHRRSRWAMRVPTGEHPLQGKKEVWQETFRNHNLNLALPRLSGINFQYDTYVSLLLQPEDWYPVALGAATATFYWRQDVPAINSFIENDEGWNLLREAFRDPIDDPPDAEVDWPSEPTFTDKYLLLPNPAIPNGIQLAQHYNALLRANYGRDDREKLAMAYLIVRHARRGLSENPNIAEGWRLLSDGYQEIFRIESLVMSPPPLVRLRQATGAIQLAQVCAPGFPGDDWTLANLLRMQSQDDLAIEHFAQFQEATGQVAILPLDDVNYEAMANAVTEYIQPRAEAIATMEQNVTDALAAEQSRVGMSMQLRNYGMTGMALRLLEEDLTVVDGSIPRTLYGDLLLRNGECERSWMTLEETAAAFRHPNNLAPEEQDWFRVWSESTALANMIAGDANRAVELCETLAESHAIRANMNAMTVAPIADRHTYYHGLWGANRGQMLAVLTTTESERWVSQQWLAACAELDAQQNEAAAKRLRMTIETYPYASLRPLIVIYLNLLTGDFVEYPDIEIPIWGGMFADDATEADDPPPEATSQSQADDSEETVEPNDSSTDPETDADAPADDNASSSDDAQDETPQESGTEEDAAGDPPPPPDEEPAGPDDATPLEDENSE